LRDDHLPFYGYPKNTAPFLSRLAAESVVVRSRLFDIGLDGPGHGIVVLGRLPLPAQRRHGLWRSRSR
jgi:hypothetical protein